MAHNDASRRAEPADPRGESTRSEDFLRQFALHDRDLYKLIFTLLPNRADAEDVFQQTSLVLWQKFGEFEPGTNFFAWAAAIARNNVRDFRKRQARDRLNFWSDELIDAVAETRLREGDLVELRRAALAQCIEQLAPSDKEIVEERYGESRTAVEVAAALGRPLNTVYKALHRIHRALYDCVDRRTAAERRKERGR